MGNLIFFRIFLNESNTEEECPCAVSINKISTPALSNSIALNKSSGLLPIAAPTNNWPFLSLTEKGNFSPL